MMEALRKLHGPNSVGALLFLFAARSDLLARCGYTNCRRRLGRGEIGTEGLVVR